MFANAAVQLAPRRADPPTMQEVLFVVAASLPLLIGAMFLYRGVRLVRVLRMVQSPEQLGAMLSQPLRDALAAEGIDPDRMDVAKLRDLDDGSDLHDRVRAELQAAFRSAMGGGAIAHPGAGAGADASTIASAGWSRPGPIDADSGGGARWMSAIAIATLIACAAVLLQR